jgi:hypothetical protein
VQEGPQEGPQGELIAILMAILLFWECLELEGAVAYQGAGEEHRVREDGELAGAVVSYATFRLMKRLSRSSYL